MGYSEIQTYTLYIPGRSRMMIFAVMAQHYSALRRLAVMRTPRLAHVESPELFLEAVTRHKQRGTQVHNDRRGFLQRRVQGCTLCLCPGICWLVGHVKSTLMSVQEIPSLSGDRASPAPTHFTRSDKIAGMRQSPMQLSSAAKQPPSLGVQTRCGPSVCSCV